MSGRPRGRGNQLSRGKNEERIQRGGIFRGGNRGGRGGETLGRGGNTARGRGRGNTFIGRGNAPRGRRDNLRGRGNNSRGRGNNSRGRGGFATPELPITSSIPVTSSVPITPPPPIHVKFEAITPNQLKQFKMTLLNTVSASLIKEPTFTGDSVTLTIRKLCQQISYYDPEFILKVTLYSRDDLGIRSTSNYLLSLAANIKHCQPFLKKYFKAIIRLPSDWLDVAATYQMLPDRYLKGDALPTALRKMMKEKFTDFDVYQLGKYNKEKSIKKKAKKQKQLIEKLGENAVPKSPKPILTIKQMIRQLHINEPPYNVMCILGKKYPMTEEEFNKNKLTGRFEPARAGQRMKLPVAETWETLLSEKGNKASTWEELIEHKKLPFMAMLRNIRNLIFTGVHPKYHRWVINKLTNETTVAMSKQFPTRFFSAYEVIPKDLDHFKQLLEKQNDGKKKKRSFKPAFFPNESIFKDYREALDTAIKHATVNNIKPIRGNTVVFCNVSSQMKQNCKTARQMGAISKLDEVGALLGLMLKYACEECTFIAFGSESIIQRKSHLIVDLIEASILENMKKVLELSKDFGQDTETFPFEYIEELIRTRKKVDNLVVISHCMVAPNHNEMSRGGKSISSLLKKYRQAINPNLLYVAIDLSGRVSVQTEEGDPLNVLVSGFSDSILRFIAERGDENQLQYVENIDVSKKLVQESQNAYPSYFDELDKLKQNVIHKQLDVPKSQWRTARVFISSTFLDMHGERDVLVRHVFPELRERCKAKKIHLFEVDLRWGVTEEETQQNKSVQICLEEIDRCRPFFIGVLGNRYGWIPNSYDVPDEPQFDWLREYPQGRSITELEIQYGALQASNSHSFFYLRDSDFLSGVPDQFKDAFVGDEESNLKLDHLKKLIQQKSKNVRRYRVAFAGLKNGQPVVKGLENFRKKVVEDLWNAIQAEFPDPPERMDENLDPLLTERLYHFSFYESRMRRFIGRKEMITKMIHTFQTKKSNSIVVIGKGGSGKSALVCAFQAEFLKVNPHVFVLSHFVGASPKSSDIRYTLHRLCNEINLHFNLNNDEPIPEDYRELCQYFVAIIEKASFLSRILLIIDALDAFSEMNRPQNLDWLPKNLPIHLVVTVLEGSTPHNILKARKTQSFEMIVAPLDLKERRDIVRETLSEFRKKLDERPMNTQMRPLLKKPDSDKPLYLLVACQELRLYGIFEQLTSRIQKMGGTLSRLFDEVLTRLEEDHGKDMIKMTFCLLACSRGGLLESEMVQLLKRENEKALPDAIWCRLYSSIEGYLKPRTNSGEQTLDFFHDQLRLAVTKRYLEFSKERQKFHQVLAEYFLFQANPEGNWNGSKRSLSELPYHQTKAQFWDGLEKTLCDLKFVETKCSLGLTFDLMNDYIFASTNLPKSSEHLKKIEEFRRYVTSSAHILITNPELCFQEAANQPTNTSPALAAEQSSSQGKFWLKWINKTQTTDPCKMTIKTASEITAIRVSPDAAEIACGLKDNSVKILSAETGIEVASLVGHSNLVLGIAYSPDGTLLATASLDESIILWDAITKTALAELKGHIRGVSSCIFSLDGKTLISGSYDGTVRFWDCITYTLIKTLKGHSKPVNSLDLSAEGDMLVSGSWDGTMILWNTNSLSENYGKEINRLKHVVSYLKDDE